MSSRSHRGHGEEHAEAENSERWLLTYSDMITLLLALFVVLFAMSTINIQKFMEFKTGIVKSFSTLQLNSLVHGGTGLLQNTSLVQRSGVATVADAFEEPPEKRRKYAAPAITRISGRTTKRSFFLPPFFFASGFFAESAFFAP